MFQIPLIIALFSSPADIEQGKYQYALAQTIVNNRMEYTGPITLEIYQSVVNYAYQEKILTKQHWSSWTNWYHIVDKDRLKEAMECLISDINLRLDVLDTCPPIDDYKFIMPFPSVKMNIDELNLFEKNWNEIKKHAPPWNSDLVYNIDCDIGELRVFWEKINSIHSWYHYNDDYQVRVALRDLRQELNGDIGNMYSVPAIPWWRLQKER